MEVWVVEDTGVDDCGSICGVYSSLGKAKQAILDLYDDETGNNVIFKQDHANKLTAVKNSCVDYEAFRHSVDWKPNVFSRPRLISDEIADLLGVDHGSTLSRAECTKRLAAYIKEHNLQNPENRRQILLDEKLAKILRYDVTQGPCYYYTLQKLITPHLLD